MEFTSLLKEGVLGFYSSCEVTTIFLLDKKSGRVYNYYTIFVFEEKEYKPNKEKYLTDRLIDLGNFRFGINQYSISIQEAISSFVNIGNNDVFVNRSGEMIIGKLSLLPKQFISADEKEKIHLNRVLKNNFYNGSYVYEFFNENKNLILGIDQEEWNKLNNLIRKKCETALSNKVFIDLFSVEDRIGNIIFQLPSNILKVDFSTEKTETKLNFNIEFDERIKEIKRYSIITLNEFDNSVQSFGVSDCPNNGRVSVYSGDTSSLNKIIIFDNINNIIVYMKNVQFIRDIHMNFNIMSEYCNCDKNEENMRTVILKNGNKDFIEIKNGNKNRRKNKENWRNIIKKRQDKERLASLEKQMKFIQYGENGINDSKKAISNIRKLIQAGNNTDIMIWDPYLDAFDILNTLYYCNESNVRLRAITSTSSEKRNTLEESKYEDNSDWMNKQQSILKEKSNNLGINIEVRCQHDSFGWKFHDRFLIKVGDSGKIQVWSLGISVNALGRSHHIIQEVSHPQHVMDAFEKLWDSLNNKRCIVWRSIDE